MPLFEKKVKTEKPASLPTGQVGPKEFSSKPIRPRLAGRQAAGGEVLGVLKSFHVTEKSSADVAFNKYVFVISQKANKVQVKKDVEARYKVNTESVRIINLPDKERRKGRQIGWKAGLRKAIVTLRKGQKIEIQ